MRTEAPGSGSLGLLTAREDNRISKPNENTSETDDYGDHRTGEQDVGFVGSHAVDLALTGASIIDFRKSTFIRVLCVWLPLRQSDAER